MPYVCPPNGPVLAAVQDLLPYGEQYRSILYMCGATKVVHDRVAVMDLIGPLLIDQRCTFHVYMLLQRIRSSKVTGRLLDSSMGEVCAGNLGFGQHLLGEVVFYLGHPKPAPQSAKQPKAKPA